MLDSISVILCEPSHPGNIGSVARAMKNMGLTQLSLVAPEQFPHAKATELASGADDVLAHARVFDSIDEAVADCHWLYGTSARQRICPWPQITAKEAVKPILEATRANQKVGILFGPERTGLSNEVLQRCDYHMTIPTHPVYPSLNLAQAVQIVSYEIFQLFLCDSNSEDNVAFADKATAAEIAGLVQHCRDTALSLEFMNAEHPKKLMPRLQRLIAKAQLEKEEINILRGFLRLVRRSG